MMVLVLCCASNQTSTLSTGVRSTIPVTTSFGVTKMGENAPARYPMTPMFSAAYSLSTVKVPDELGDPVGLFMTPFSSSSAVWPVRRVARPSEQEDTPKLERAPHHT